MSVSRSWLRRDIEKVNCRHICHLETLPDLFGGQKCTKTLHAIACPKMQKRIQSRRKEFDNLLSRNRSAAPVARSQSASPKRDSL